MRLNITEDYVSLEEFKAMLDKCENIKDVHLLCHQAGCPMYVIRNNGGNCIVVWHPYADESRNVFNLYIVDSQLECRVEEGVIDFIPLEDLKKDFFIKHVLGNTPFDPNYCVWKKEVIKQGLSDEILVKLKTTTVGQLALKLEEGLVNNGTLNESMSVLEFIENFMD